MFDYIYADFVLFLNVHFATSTLQKELLVIFDQQKVGFMLIFAAKIEKKAKYVRTFQNFRYNRARDIAIYKTKSFTDYLEIHFFLYNYRVGLNIFRFLGII